MTQINNELHKIFYDRSTLELNFSDSTSLEILELLRNNEGYTVEMVYRNGISPFKYLNWNFSNNETPKL